MPGSKKRAKKKGKKVKGRKKPEKKAFEIAALKPDAFLRELEDALDEARFDDVRGLIDRIDPTKFSDKQAKKALGSIRRKRLFVELEKAAGIFYFAGSQRPVVLRQWAQALLDQNRLSQGLAALRSAEPEVEDDPKEGPEIRGLIGRAYKQRFVDEGGHEDLRRAISSYRGDWRDKPDENRWHGINLVALLARAERDVIDSGVNDNPRVIAKRILNDIEDLDERSVWDYGTAMEAAIALDDKEGALKWAKKYVRHPEADAFELGSTWRQMREIWQLEGSDLGGALLPVVEYALSQRGGATFAISKGSQNSEGFEAVWGAEGAIPLDWTDNMHKRCRSIARVFDAETKERHGTGFLIKASDLREDLGDQIVFATNSHVISENPADKAPLQPGDGSAEFTRLDGKPKVSLGKLLYSSPKRELDISILEIEAPANEEPLKATAFAPALPDDDETQRVYIVGHPNGRPLEVTLYDNNLAEYEMPYVRYRSPTEGGHSGSPVFNRKWRTFAIHHRAREEKQLNEGVLFEAIKSA